ncbi:hypothetical protein WG66_002561, partial [Moniliophthora roreri]
SGLRFQQIKSSCFFTFGWANAGRLTHWGIRVPALMMVC